MGKDDIMTGLDVGSHYVRIAVGQITGAEERVHILGVGEVPSEGMSKGVVTSIEDVVSSVSAALEKAERMTGIPIEHAYVNINGSHIMAQSGHGVVAVSKADGEIKEDDVARVIDAAQTVATPPNYEIIHVIPQSFTVDNQHGIKDPIGMTGLRMEVHAQIILGLMSQIKNLTKCVYRTSVDIDDLVLGSLGCAEAVLTKRQKELGVALINIGGATTNLLVFEEGDVMYSKIFPLGSAHITNDIAIGLRTSIDIAEKIKLTYGSCMPEEVDKKEVFDLHDIHESEPSAGVSKKHVAEIIEARTEEIFKMVDKELERIDRSGLLPAGVVLTGGGAKLPGMVMLAKQLFKLPASVWISRDLITAIDHVADPSFTTAVGLVLWGSSARPMQKGRGGQRQSFSAVGEVTGKMKKWIQGLMP